MREAALVIAAAGCALTALVFGKSLDNDWASVLMSVLFAGCAGILLAMAAG